MAQTERPDGRPARRVGLVGLGAMGSALAARLAGQGWQPVVWNRSPAPVEAATSAGAVPAAAPQECLQAELVLSILAHDAAVDAVFTEEVLRSAPPGTVHVNMATISAAAARRFAARHAEAGVGYVASPVLGRNNVARAGQLVALVAGPAADVERARPVLADITRRVWPLGERPADANTFKIAINYQIVHALQALSESVVLLERSGLDGSRFVEIIGDSLFPGPVFTGYGGAIAAHRYEPPGFTTELGRKDLLLALDAAAAVGLELPTGGALRQVFDEAVDAGLGQLDWAAVSEVTRGQAAKQAPEQAQGTAPGKAPERATEQGPGKAPERAGRQEGERT